MAEYTLSIIKPDAVKRNLIGKINSILESNNFKIVAQKMMLLSSVDAEIFYGVHKEKPFFKDLCKYMTSGPIVVQVLKSIDAVKKYREIMGATNPENADENTIRKVLENQLKKIQYMAPTVMRMQKLKLVFSFHLGKF